MTCLVNSISVLGILLHFGIFDVGGLTNDLRSKILPKCLDSTIPEQRLTIPYYLMNENESASFLLEFQQLDCEYSEFTISLTPPIESTFNSDQAESEDEALLNPSKFIRNGNLFYSYAHFQTHQFCIQRVKNEYIEIRVCPVVCSTDVTGPNICVQKCCPVGQKLNENFGCSASDKDWKPIGIHHDDVAISCLNHDDQSTQCIHSVLPDQIHYQNFFTGECENIHSYTSAEAKFGVTVDKFHLADEKSLILGAGNYCIDGLLGSNVDVAIVCEHACESDQHEDTRNSINIFYIVTMYISACFLFLTVIVYVLTWDKHNVHGWTVFSLSISMSLMLIFLGTARCLSLNSGREELSGTSRCFFVGIAAHYLFLTTFSLLTCLSFDLWWTFRTLTPSVGKSKGLLRFKLYLLFSLGIPFLISIIGITLDKRYLKVPRAVRIKQKLIIPEFGINSCYISDKLALGVYVFIPVAILLSANLLFFLRTMWLMWNYHQNTQRARQNSVKQKQTAYLFMKLFFVMGVTWTAEVIEYLVSLKKKEIDDYGCPIYDSPGILWIFTDLLNILQGICIFIIFVCKKQIMVHLVRRNPSLRGKSTSRSDRCKVGQGSRSKSAHPHQHFSSPTSNPVHPQETLSTVDSDPCFSSNDVNFRSEKRTSTYEASVGPPSTVSQTEHVVLLPNPSNPVAHLGTLEGDKGNYGNDGETES